MARSKTAAEYKERWSQPDYFNNIIKNGLGKNNTFQFWNVINLVPFADGQDYRNYLEAFSKYLDLKHPEEKREFMRLPFNSTLEENKDIASKINSIKQDGLILDLGCGVCTLYDSLSKRNKSHYYGIDIAADILREFSNAPTERIIQMSVFDCKNLFEEKCSSVIDCHVGSKLNVRTDIESLASALLVPNGKYYGM